MIEIISGVAGVGMFTGVVLALVASSALHPTQGRWAAATAEQMNTTVRIHPILFPRRKQPGSRR